MTENRAPAGMNPGMYEHLAAYIFCQLLGFMTGFGVGATAIIIWEVVL